MEKFASTFFSLFSRSEETPAVSPITQVTRTPGKYQKGMWTLHPYPTFQIPLQPLDQWIQINLIEKQTQLGTGTRMVFRIISPSHNR